MCLSIGFIQIKVILESIFFLRNMQRPPNSPSLWGSEAEKSKAFCTANKDGEGERDGRAQEGLFADDWDERGLPGNGFQTVKEGNSLFLWT